MARTGNYCNGLPRPKAPRNSMGAEQGPAAPAAAAPGAFLRREGVRRVKLGTSWG